MFSNKTILLIICFVLIKINAKTQTVEWGNPQRQKGKTNYSQILGENSSGIFLIRCRDNDFQKNVLIEKYKSNLTLESAKEMPLKIPGTIEKVLLIGDRVFVFLSAKNVISDKIDVLVQKLDMNLNIDGGLTTIASINENQMGYRSNFYIKNSSDKSKIGLMFLTTSPEKNRSALNMFTYNIELQQIYGKRFELNYDDRDVFITNYDLDNSGNSFLLLDYPKDLKRRKDFDPRVFFLNAYFHQSDKMLEYELGSGEKSIEELGMCINNFNKEVNVVGFFSNENNGKIAGYFNLNIDISSTEIRNKVYDTIPMNIFSKQSFIRNGGNDLTDMFIRKLAPRSDGGCMMVAEKYFQTRQSYTYYVNGFAQTNSRTVFNYNDVMLLSFNKNGSIQFCNIIPKEQQSVSDGGYYSSIAPVITNDNFYTLFNGDVNQEGDIMLNMSNYAGKSENKVLVKAVNQSSLLIPRETKQTSANSIIACTIREKRFTLMRVTF